MSDEMNPFPEELSDEAAFALAEALQWLAFTCDAKYLGQIRRHMATLDTSVPVDPERPWGR